MDQQIPDGLELEFTQLCRYGAVGERKTISYSTALQLIIRGYAKEYKASAIVAPIASVSPTNLPRPIVTAICPTYNRRKYLPTSISLFLAQTFTNSELLIVDDSTESITDLVPKHPRIRYIRCERMNTGAKRNLCCENARGEIIVHWDDDDWQAPARIEDQVRELNASNKAVLTYRNILYWNEETQRAYRCWPNDIQAPHGATLCYRKDWWEKHKFIDQLSGEDTEFGFKARGKGQFHVADAKETMVVRAHGHSDSPVDRGNTCNTSNSMGGVHIPEIDRNQIPSAFFEPLLSAVILHKTAFDDVVIAAVQNYGWKEIKSFAHSLVRSGFKGTKLLLVNNISSEARTQLLALNFTIVDVPQSPRFVVEGRFAHAIEYLKSHAHRYVIWTDVRDLVFQSDPSAWLENNLAPSRIVAASEWWPFKVDPRYNDMWLRNTVPTDADYQRIRSEEVWCGGTLAGEADTMCAAMTQIYNMVRVRPAGNDQGALNYVLRTSPFKEITRAPRTSEGFVATCSVFSTDSFKSYAARPQRTDTPPLFDRSRSMVLTPDGKTPFSIVHQYDRDSSWTPIIEKRYADASVVKKEMALVLISSGDVFCDKYLMPLLASIRKFLLVQHEILVFTDTQTDLGSNVRKVNPSIMKNASMHRYHAILSEKEWLSSFKNIFYLDTDCLLMAPIGNEILGSGITATLHAWGGFGGASFEANINSAAYVDYHAAKAYYQGSFQGGKTEEFLAMSEILTRNIDIDSKNGIRASAIDESHFNRFLFEHPPATVLPATYCYVPGVVKGSAKIRHFNANAWVNQ